jgi:hypothetical protein
VAHSHWQHRHSPHRQRAARVQRRRKVTGAPTNTDSTTTVQPSAPSEATPADPTSDSPATAHRARKSNMSNTSTTPDANAQAKPPMEHNQPQSSDDSSAMQKGSENNAATAPQSTPQ